MNTGGVGACEALVAEIGGWVLMLDIENHEVQCVHRPSL